MLDYANFCYGAEIILEIREETPIFVSRYKTSKHYENNLYENRGCGQESQNQRHCL
jgi:hypothetical protein